MLDRWADLMGHGIKHCLGCNAKGRWDQTGRCPSCKRRHKAKYRKAEYVAERAHLKALVAVGAIVLCVRCGLAITSVDDLDTGHQDDGTLGPEHRLCNRGNGR